MMMEIINEIIGYFFKHWVEVVGYIASILVAASFYMKTIIPLRVFAILSNIAFMTYGFFGGLYPVLILHVFLFPLNILRLFQMKKLISDVKDASHNDVSMDALIPYMSKIRYKKGDVLFEKGDTADRIYYIANGSIKLVDLDINVGKNQIIGEMGIFSPYKERTDTAVCNKDMDIYLIDEDKIKQLYYQNPSFGFHLIKLLTKRFIINFTSMDKNIKNKSTTKKAANKAAKKTEGSVKKKAVLKTAQKTSKKTPKKK